MRARLRCAIRSFLGTLRGLGTYEFDGHVYDDGRRLEVRGSRQYEIARCAECGAEVEQGWHRLAPEAS